MILLSKLGTDIYGLISTVMIWVYEISLVSAGHLVLVTPGDQNFIVLVTRVTKQFVTLGDHFPWEIGHPLRRLVTPMHSIAACINKLKVCGSIHSSRPQEGT